MAAQLMGRKRASLRGEFSWSAFATSSLPVPDSPTIRTFDRVGATISIWRKSASIGFEWLMSFPNFSPSRLSSSTTRRERRRFSTIAEARLRSSNRSTGFVR